MTLACASSRGIGEVTDLLSGNKSWTRVAASRLSFRSLARARFDRLIYVESVDDRDETAIRPNPKRRYFVNGSVCAVGRDRDIRGRRIGRFIAEPGNLGAASGAVELAGRLRLSVLSSMSGRGLREHGGGPLGDVRMQLHVVCRVGVGRQLPAHRLVRPGSDERLELAECCAPRLVASRLRPGARSRVFGRRWLDRLGTSRTSFASTAAARSMSRSTTTQAPTTRTHTCLTFDGSSARSVRCSSTYHATDGARRPRPRRPADDECRCRKPNDTRVSHDEVASNTENAAGSRVDFGDRAHDGAGRIDPAEHVHVAARAERGGVGNGLRKIAEQCHPMVGRIEDVHRGARSTRAHPACDHDLAGDRGDRRIAQADWVVRPATANPRPSSVR